MEAKKTIDVKLTDEEVDKAVLDYLRKIKVITDSDNYKVETVYKSSNNWMLIEERR